MKDIMLLDGGIGQELVKRNLSTKDPLWSARVLLDNFELVKNLHIEFLNSGSTIITTNSYSCTPQRLKRFNLENEFENLNDSDLKTKTAYFKKEIRNGKKLDDILPEAFAAVREASKRTIGQRHFDVQLIGGICLHQGKIAEMKTGEGKTLVSTLPFGPTAEISS